MTTNPRIAETSASNCLLIAARSADLPGAAESVTTPSISMLASHAANSSDSNAMSSL